MKYIIQTKNSLNKFSPLTFFLNYTDHLTKTCVCFVYAAPESAKKARSTHARRARGGEAFYYATAAVTSFFTTFGFPFKLGRRVFSLAPSLAQQLHIQLHSRGNPAELFLNDDCCDQTIRRALHYSASFRIYFSLPVCYFCYLFLA